jgi:hypothetical protein
MTLFVSYSSKDEVLVKDLTAAFMQARMEVWLDQKLRGGDPWWQDILRQIRECDVFIFALSENSLASKPCRAELAYARALDVPILPVLIGPVPNLRATPVADIQVVDYRKRTDMTGIALIAGVQDAIRSRRPLPDPLPPAPPVPFEYLLRLGEAMDATHLPPDQQGNLLRQLRECLETEDDEGVREDARGLLRALRRRSDVTHRHVVEIDELLGAEAERKPVTVPTRGTEADGAHREDVRPDPGPSRPDPGPSRAEPQRESGQQVPPQREAPHQPPPYQPPPQQPPQAGPQYPAQPPFQGAGTPPGWYLDPGGSGAERYWDGSGWSGHLRGGHVAAPSPSNVLSIVGIVCGAVGILLFPIIIGVAGIVCAVIAKARKEKLSTVALGVSIGGTVLGFALGYALASSYMY